MGKNGFWVSDFFISLREIIASVSIVAIMLLFGILISEKISDYQTDKNEVYNKAIKIESTELFQYGMDTNVGNAFIYGDLEAIDTVTYPEIGGEYMYVKKVKEKYTKHTRTVTTTVNGKTQTRTEVYWTWDAVAKEEKQCNEIKFCSINFDSNKIQLPGTNYITTIKESSHIRYKYYGTETEHTGTLFTCLQDGTISDSSSFYKNSNIAETVERLQVGGGVLLFWILWILLIAFCLYGFYYLDNNWLEG